MMMMMTMMMMMVRRRVPKRCMRARSEAMPEDAFRSEALAGPGGSIYHPNSNEVTGNQPWQWTIPRFTNDFPIKTSIYRRFPATFDTASGNMSSGATSQLSSQHG